VSDSGRLHTRSGICYFRSPEMDTINRKRISLRISDLSRPTSARNGKIIIKALDWRREIRIDSSKKKNNNTRSYRICI